MAMPVDGGASDHWCVKHTFCWVAAALGLSMPPSVGFRHRGATPEHALISPQTP